MGDLDGKIALITGASSGIGAATAVVFARHGADVVINYRQNLAAAVETGEKIRALGRRALLVQADVCQREAVREMVAFILAEWDMIDILVSNVGHPYYVKIEDLLPQDWYRSLDENLTSQVYCIQAVLPHMIARKSGRMVALSSISAQRGSPSGDVAYSATKSAIVALVKTLARQVAGSGIAINAVAPGIIDTGTTESMTAEQKRANAAAIPMGRLGRGEEVGELIAFLASDRASYITGQLVAVNGGLYL
jgi:3-oxoacyl-[acyl-carrier protein] reductase